MNQITRTSPLEKEGLKLRRRFLGKTENFKSKEEKHFYNRMLKAYLKGNEYFFFGINEENNQPNIVKIEQEYYYDSNY